MKRDFYRICIACVLRQSNNRASTRIIRERLDNLLKRGVLTIPDFQRVPSGGIRWWIDARYERKTMVRAGLLKSDSPWGIWELTGKGRWYADKVWSELEAEAKRG